MLEYDELTQKLYQENINWIYSIIKKLDIKGIERKDKFITDPYIFNEMISLGYYFMNLYVISNISSYSADDKDLIMTSIIKGASTYNQYKLEQVYKRGINLSKLVESYNSIVRKTKAYAPNDGLKARVIAVDEVYRRIYDVFNKQHFNIFIKIFLASYFEYEKQIEKTIHDYLNKDV